MTVTMTTFDGVPFDLLIDRTARAAVDWIVTPDIVRERVPYSNITVTEHTGFGPARIAWEAMLDTREDYYALVARIGTTGTLVLPAGIQSLRGTETTLGNPPQVYDVLDGVELAELGDPVLYLSGSVRATLTFQRPVDPVTRLAVTS